MKRLALTILLWCLLLMDARGDRGTPVILSPNPTASESSAVIRCAGDFVIHDNLLKSASKAGNGNYDFSSMLSEIAAYLSEADYTFTNVDGVMGTQEFAREHGYHGYPSFSTPNTLIYNLKDIGVDMLTLANNHALDYWYEGLISTVTAVKGSGVTSIGGYRSRQEKLTPCVVAVNGIKIGFLNYTDGLNKMDQRKALDKAALEYGVDFLERADVGADILRLRQAGAELIVCYMHWGIEYRTEPDKNQKTNAQMLANAGVDVIIGGGPHMVQRAEYLTAADGRKVLCLYSLGNFLSDQRGKGKDCGIIFDFTVNRDAEGTVTVSDPCFRTTWVWRRQNGSTFEYRVLFTDNDPARPRNMSAKDYARMLESAGETAERMNGGCAVPANIQTDADPIVSVPGRH